jgi:hypothetical protein
MEQTLLGLSRRFRLKTLERHHKRRAVQIAFTVINATISIGLIGSRGALRKLASPFSNRLAGLHYPLWRASHPAKAGP